MSTEEKKISDVILEMQAKIDRLVGLFSNIDNNVKIILNRLNQPVQKPGPAPTVSAVGVAATKPFQQGNVKLPPGPAPQVKEKEFDEDVLVAKPFDESYDFTEDREIIEEVVHKGKRRDLRKPADHENGTKVAVSQPIQYNNGKVLFLANVEVFDMGGNLIKQARTNQKGRWIAPLEPGDYTVHVTKRQTENKIPVDLKYKIHVPSSSGPVELPAPEMPDI